MEREEIKKELLELNFDVDSKRNYILDGCHSMYKK